MKGGGGAGEMNVSWLLIMTVSCKGVIIRHGNM